MTIEWSQYASYCKVCQKPFRVSAKTLADQIVRDGGTIPEDVTAHAAVYCLVCAGGNTEPGEIITAHDIAEKFIEVIRKWLTPVRFQTMLERNKVETNPNICHSHDFCDANMAMAEAFERFGLPTPSDELGEESFALWNTAWEITLKAKFDAALVRAVEVPGNC